MCTKNLKKYPFVLVVFAYLLFPLSAIAAPPSTMTYQGRLTDSAGEPVEDTLDMSFRIFENDTGGQAIWSDIYESIDINDGNFSVQLNFNDQIQDLFDGRPLWLEVKIGNDILRPRSPVDSVPYAFYAGNAVNAENAVSFNDKSYDDVVTAAATAALEVPLEIFEEQSGESMELLAVIQNLSRRIDELEEKLDKKPDLDSQEPGGVLARLDAIETEVDRFDELTTNISRQTINGYDAIVFEGLNVHIRNGTEAVHWEEGYQNNPFAWSYPLEALEQNNNGLGNLIIGYDEPSHFHDTSSDQNPSKAGSHNLIVGPSHTYMGVGGLVAGFNNIIGDIGSVVSGGSGNRAVARFGSISGGGANYVTKESSSISGGAFNEVHWRYSSISGGYGNTIGVWKEDADELEEQLYSYASITGGENNMVCGAASSINGGSNNFTGRLDDDTDNCAITIYGYTYGSHASITGGHDNQAVGTNSSIHGGEDNITYGDRSSISGGSKNITGEINNKSSGYQSTIGGGIEVTITESGGWMAKGDLMSP